MCIAGRRGGKTELAIRKLQKAAVDRPHEYWYTAETYRQAKLVAWPKLKSHTPRQWIRKTNESELRMELVNGSVISLHGRENPDALRGPGLGGIVNDEFCVQVAGDKGRETWQEVLRPMLSDTGGWGLFISTPKGYNWGFDLYQSALDPDNEDWTGYTWTTLEGGWVSESEVEAAKRDLDPRSFRQEYEASFEALSGRVYDYFERSIHVSEDVEDTGAEILIGQDFNINPMASVIAVRVGDECHVLDALELPVSNTEEVAQEYQRRFGDRYVVITPDPSGRARKTSAPVGQTDFTILERAGFDVRAPKKAPLVPDRINNTQANLMSASKRVRVKIHPRAKALIKGLQGLTYKEGTSQPDKTSGLDHICDAFDYLLWQEFNRLEAPSSVTVSELSL